MDGLVVDSTEGIGDTPSALIPLSMMQSVIWLDQTVHTDLPCYQIGMCVDIQSALDVDLLRQAIIHVAQSHDALRMVPCSGTSETELAPYLRVLGTVDVALPLLDMRGHDATRATALAQVQRIFSSPAPLRENVLPWDMLLVRYADQGYLWMHRYHHLVIDGYGVPMAGRAMVDAYNSLLAGQPLSTTPAPSYRALLDAEAAYTASPRYERDLAFWQQRYASLPPALLSPYLVEASGATPGSGKQVWRMPRLVYQQVMDYAAALGLTAPHFFLALIHSALSRMHAVEDIVIGVPVHNRTTPAQRQTIGMFASMNPIGVSVDRGRSFTQQMQAMADELRRCLRHQRLPIAEINRVVQLSATGRSQIFDVSFSFESFSADVRMGDGHPRFWTLHNSHEQTPLAIAAKDYHHDDGLLLEFVFNRAYLDEAEVARLIGRLQTACEAVLGGWNDAIDRLPLLPHDEALLLQRFNATDAPFEADIAIHALFERQAERHPQRVALDCNGIQLSYAELNTRANRLARRLQDEGVQANALVAVVLERSIEMVTALLAVLKAGAAYVPLDPHHPPERLTAMLSEVSPSLVLMQSAWPSHLTACPCPVVVLLPDTDAVSCDDDDGRNVKLGDVFSSRSLAYVIFTSGSTGRPKGVMNEHRGVVNRLQWMQKAYSLDADDRVLQKTPYGFDVSVWEFFWPLMTGARLVMAEPGGHQDPAYLVQKIEACGITTLHFVPSMLQAFLIGLKPGDCASLRQVICSGEELPWALQQQVLARLRGVQLHNLYGPTEAAIDVTAWTCGSSAAAHPGNLVERVPRVPIGKPIDNIRIHILDALGQPVPIGAHGEIHIGGVGVARGYLNRPDLTAASFIPDLFATPHESLQVLGSIKRAI